MLTIFKPGDIIQKEVVIDEYSISPLPIHTIGRVLKIDIDTGIIIFDVVIIDGQVKTGLEEFSNYGFKLVDPELAESFNKYIKTYAKNQDKIFVDFIDLYKRANVETKYKIMDYILTAEIKDGNNAY